MSRPVVLDTPPRSGWLSAGLVVATGCLTVAWQLFLLLSKAAAASRGTAEVPPFLSPGLWESVLRRFGDRILLPQAHWQIPFPKVLITVAVVGMLAWLGGAALIARRRGWPFAATAAVWGWRGWIWWLLPLVGEGLQIIGDVFGEPGIAAILNGTLSLWWSLLIAGWLATGWSLASCTSSSSEVVRNTADDFRVPKLIWLAVLTYSVCYTILNWQLYAAMLVPHGDSSMYEEHLWNLLHGKGFRSYLDNGRLFLGEHIQVIHLLLIPLYLAWPSHLLLELCQSVGLASAAIPVYWIARRHTGSPRAALALACAYLLYFPMQFLDISVDFKTFRPSALEIPLLLFGLDALERHRYRAFLGYLVLMLLCQEDAAMIMAPLGVWIAARQYRLVPVDHPWRSKVRWLGAGLAVFGVCYVVFVIKIALPYFRSWQDVHFASYFSQFGHSTGEIVRTILSRPQLLFREWLGAETWVYLLALLLPLAGVSLLSPGRAFVAAPLFGVLCLNTLARTPLHHFHAPLIPVLFWAAAAGLAAAPRFWQRTTALWRRVLHKQAKPTGKATPLKMMKERCVPTGRQLPVKTVARSAASAVPALRTPAVRLVDLPAIEFAARFALLCSLVSGIWFSLGPLGISFWDPHSAGYWKTKYVPGERVSRFSEVLSLIPSTSRVASTDFVHPRFTHYERSYDYSDYRPVVPDDTDFIVIDTQGPYSKIHEPQQVKEYRDHPDQWELLPDRTGGYFIVLRRIRK